MPKRKKSDTEIEFKEMTIEEAQRAFNRRRGRGSKYDEVIEAAEGLAPEKALIVEGVSYSEVTGIRNRLKAYVGEGLRVEATKVDQEQGLYDVLIHRKGEGRGAAAEP